MATNGDQVAAHYATDFPALFRVVSNGTPGQPPAAGDVLSLSAAPGFDSASGGHTAVVQAAAVDAAGNGTVTVIEENGSAAGVARLAVTGWTGYPGFRYLEWLASTGQPVIRQSNPQKNRHLATKSVDNDAERDKHSPRSCLNGDAPRMLGRM